MEAEQMDADSDSSFSGTNSTSSSDENDPSQCSLCRCTNRPTTQISDCKELKSIKDIIESQTRITKVNFACQTCLYKIYTVIDQSRLKTLKEEREQRLAAVGALLASTGAINPTAVTVSRAAANSEEIPISPSSSSSSSSSSAKVTSSVMKDHHENVDLNESVEMIINENGHQVENEAMNELEDEELQHHAASNRNVNNISSTAMANNDGLGDDGNEDNEKQMIVNGNFDVVSNLSSSSNHLDVMYELSEAALNTESGGTSALYKKESMVCHFCGKQFVLERAYYKHLKTHENKTRSGRSKSNSRGRITPAKEIYRCENCNATFATAAKLREHSKIHLKRFYCPYCHIDTRSALDHDFHVAQCEGIYRANNDIVPTRRVTRSVARTIRAQNESLPKTARTAKSFETAKSTVNTKSVVSARTAKTKRTLRSRKSSATNSKKTVYDDDDDGAASTAYTLCTQYNLSFVENWLDKSSKVRFEDDPILMLGRIKKGVRQERVIVSQKEYDVIMLERLLLHCEHKRYPCTVDKCRCIFDNMGEKFYHEVTTHGLKPFFYCRKCKKVFPTRLFLDYHFYLQTYAEYRCNKCTMTFNYEYQLHYHLEQHQRNEPFPCLYCANSYISDLELRIHCLETGHDPKQMRKIISIDHTMTISNQTPPEPLPPKRKYECTINIMNIPKVPSRRINLVDAKTKYRMGDVDFEMPPRRNCVRTN